MTTFLIISGLTNIYLCVLLYEAYRINRDLLACLEACVADLAKLEE